ncbi:MAG: glycosyltransferase 87 family protein [Solirubrobacterales bacterium]
MAALALAALAYYLVPRVGDPGAHWPLWDVNVYQWGGQRALHGQSLYGAGGPSFTYPPFAALVFAIGAVTSLADLQLAISCASVVSLLALCWFSLGASGLPCRLTATAALAAVALLVAPVTETLRLGEVNLLLAALVALDLLRNSDAERWQGAPIGLAAGIKLTPLVFVPFLMLTGRLRAAAVAVGAFATTVALGALVLPTQSRAFWLGGAAFDVHRIGDPASPGNQSLAGALARLGEATTGLRPWWLLAALVVGASGLGLAAWAQRRGNRLGAVVLCAITGLLVSPFSWGHHWVWAVPLLLALLALAWERSSWLLLLAALAAAIVFGGLVPLPRPGPHPDLWRLLQDDLYVLCGLAVLAGAGLAFAVGHLRGRQRTGRRTFASLLTLRRV